jgi:hypothetical protein
MFTTRGVIHSFYAGRKWHSTDNFSSPCLRPPTTSLPPFDLPPAEEQRLILNLAHGCFGSFRFSPKNNITYITILLPDNIPFKPIPEFPQPPNDFEAEMWTYQEHEAYESKERRHRYSLEERESCYRRLMRATVQVVLSIVATAQFVLPKPVEILVVGLPYCPEGERPQAALRSMIKTYGSVPNASFAPDWRVTPAIFRRLLTAVAERILSLDHLKFQTCDQYRKGVGDKAYKEATRAVNIWPGDRKFQRPVPMSVLARLERLRGADTSEDATLTRNPYSSAGEDEPL